MEYRTIQGQAWDEIAKEVYGSEKDAWRLMRENPKLLDIFTFPEGVIIQVPEVEYQGQELPPWRR